MDNDKEREYATKWIEKWVFESCKRKEKLKMDELEKDRAANCKFVRILVCMFVAGIIMIAASFLF